MGKNYRYLLGLLFGLLLIQPAQAQYSLENIITLEAEGATQVYAADIDNDDDLDVLSTSLLDNKIAWYENLDGLGQFGSQQIVSEEALKVNAIDIVDVDNDGDLDIVSASRDDNKIAWYENVGAGVFGAQQVISTNAFVAQFVFSADVDGDGDYDVLSASRDDNKIAWYENLNGLGSFGDQQVISDEAIWAVRVLAADLDGDGDLDVVSASEQDDKVAWYPNTDGAGTFGDPIIITTNADAVRDIKLEDVDGDGDYDILSASAADDKIAWYENTDGAGTFSAEQIISTQADFAQAVHAVDVDLDGDLDVVSASINDAKIAWYENRDGHGDFGPQIIVSSNAFGTSAIAAANIDGDEDMDLLSASSFGNSVSWYESFAGRGRVHFSPQIVIGGFAQAMGAHAVFGADIDGDGDKDVLSASFDDDKIAWYPNVLGTLRNQEIISVSAAGARDVYAADMDGDGDQDVLSASGDDNAIRWYENFDGLGSFDLIHEISTNASNAYAVFAADLDGDGDQDVLSASSADDKIAWYENLDGDGEFGDQIVITKAARGATDVVAADFDGDGDIDVASSSTFDDKIAWYENLDGEGSFGEQRVITTSADLAIAVHAADIDGDGDADLVSASSGDDKIAWYKNLDGLGTFSAQKIISAQVSRAFAVTAADLDNDGDMDLISAARDGNTVAWHENKGDERFNLPQVITSDARGVRSVTSFDLDGDGDPDVLSASQDDNVVAWYENLSVISNILSSEDVDQIPAGFSLGEIYPNPFLQRANVELSLEQTQDVDIRVYDIQGRLIDVLHSGILLGKQVHRIEFVNNNLPAGLYFVRVQGTYFQATRKAMLVK